MSLTYHNFFSDLLFGMMNSKPSNVLFVDSLGNQYLVRDVPGDGNCALHALLQTLYLKYHFLESQS